MCIYIYIFFSNRLTSLSWTLDQEQVLVVGLRGFCWLIPIETKQITGLTKLRNYFNAFCTFKHRRKKDSFGFHIMTIQNFYFEFCFLRGKRKLFFDRQLSLASEYRILKSMGNFNATVANFIKVVRTVLLDAYRLEMQMNRFFLFVSFTVNITRFNVQSRHFGF